MLKSGFGSSGAAASSFAVVASAVFVPSVLGVGAGSLVVRSLVVDGSMAASWFGTARGVGTAPWPPAATAAAAGSVVGLSSSSQSISSSPSPPAAVNQSC